MESDVSVEDEEVHGILVSRKQGNPLFGRPLKSCHATGDLCLKLIRQAMFKNQWDRAAGLLTSYLQTMECRNVLRQKSASENIWRLGTEILLNHPKSTSEDINVFHEIMKNLGMKHYLLISLEQVYHNLCNGETDEAYRVLSLAESWRNGLHSAEQKRLQSLIQAHRAVLNYRSWKDRRSAMSQDDAAYPSRSSSTQAIGSYYRQATGTFQEILKFPGVWDPFVLNYVDLLESSGDKTEAEKVLTSYASNPKNPPNPNAHVYLYNFMKRNEASREKLIDVLRVLHSMTPSHKLMLKFSKLLYVSGSEDDQRLSLNVLFDLLDFSGWKDSVKAWKYLGKRMKDTFWNSHKDWIIEAWQPRSSWWPSYHFAMSQATKDRQKCAELSMKKALVAGMLMGLGCVYYSSVYCSEKKKKGNKKTLNRMKEFIKKYQMFCADV
ncbi:TATA box-binding protein-associated factor RNA polymerase I subunit A [Leptodactylus fuscus]|uniref:TATA box-binding protein-associated factor RNA polymerase I subunit A n=1 Tax=Leptodactylus fuscus TaxID=238119 RepID=UPI003F4E9EF3